MTKILGMPAHAFRLLLSSGHTYDVYVLNCPSVGQALDHLNVMREKGYVADFFQVGRDDVVRINMADVVKTGYQDS
jgi:hypothetical protein